MKKRLVLGLVMILALACVLVSCNSEVSAENGAGSAKTGSIVIGQEASKAVGYTVSYTDTVEDLYWYYTAAKKDNGYTSGQVTTLTAVSNEKGLQGKTLTNFSYGLWDLNFYGFKQTSDSSNIANAVYTGSVLNFLVHQDVNNATVNLELGNASTEIVFGDIYFTFDHDVHESTFTLAVTDNMGTVTVPTSGVISNEGQTVTFTGLTYAGTTSNISGEHTMVFTLSQVLSGENNITIEAANYTLPFTVTTGTKTTISGDLTQNNQTGDIYINSASLSAAAAVSVSKALSTKVVPVTSTSIEVDGNGAGTAIVSTNTTISNGDLKVTYPVGAKIAVDGTTTKIDTTTVDKKSDAQTGFEYVSDTASNTNISIATTEAVSQYELTINLAENNTVLAPVEKYIGTGLVITNIFHNSDTPMSKTYVDGATEYWQYNSTTGYLTLYVFHASPFDIVYQKVVAYIGTKSYYSLASAFAAAESGNTITLAMDVPMDSGYSLSKPLVLKQDNVTFDLNGKEITDVTNFTLTMQGENITVKNGKITSGVNTPKTTDINSYVLVLNRCNGVVLDGLTLTGGISVGGSQDDWGSETATKTDKPYVISSVGYAGTSTGVVIRNCDVTSGDFYAICSQMNSQATIKSGTYTANTENSCSTSKVIHGYFVGTDGPQGYITVEGGTFNGSIDSSNAGWVVLQGGTYSVDPTSSSCIAYDYFAYQKESGVWKVYGPCGENKVMDLNTEVYYSNLADAISGATSGDTLVLLKNIDVTSATSLSKSLTLDLNGKGITASNTLFNIYDSSVDLVIKDSGNNGAINCNAGKAIYVSSGSLKIEGGDLKVYSASTITNGVQVGSSGHFEMTDGSIEITAESTSNYNYCVNNSGTTIISGGTFVARASGGNYTIDSTGGTTTISGGVFEAYACAVGWTFYSPYVLYGSGSKTVTGGYYRAIGDSATYSTGHLVDGSSTVLQGGYFGGVNVDYSEVSSRVSSEFEMVDNTDSLTSELYAKVISAKN